MASASVISVNSLSAGYDGNHIVDDVSFDIREGEIFGLVGLNGAGKTTLIKTILGLRERYAGDIIGSGSENISYLPERFEPPWFLNGYDFIRFSMKLYNRTATNDEIERAAQKVSLSVDYLGKYTNTYSKGMRQKLGLLASTLVDCPLLILDEPMSGLDPKARQEVKEIIQAVKNKGKSVFMSSHILADVEELCDRVAVFHNNKIIFLDTPEMLKKKGENQNLEKAFLSLIAA